MENEEMEMIAKGGPRQMAESDEISSGDTIDGAVGERPEMPSEMDGFPGNGGGFPGEMTTGTVATTETNEWLAPMTATGIISGVVMLAAAAICVTMVMLKKKS